MLDVIKKLIAIRSDGDETACMDFLYNYLSTLYKKKVIIKKEYILKGRYNLIIQNSSDPKLLLAWHLDTVPISSIDQLLPITKDGKLYGRWSIDMKWWVGIIIDMIPTLLEKGIPFMILFYCDEEYNFLWMKSFTKNYIGKISPMLTIIPEATNLKIVTGFRWIAEYNISIKWKAAHAARSYEWISAIDVLCWCKDYLLKKFSCYDTGVFSTSINIWWISWWSIVEGELMQKWNVVADYCSALLDIRFWYALSQSTFDSALQTYCDEKWVIVESIQCNFRLPNLSQDIRNLYSQFAPIDTGATFGYSDIQMIQEYIWWDCILCWPSPSNKSHKEDEYVQIDSLYKAKDIIESIIYTKFTMTQNPL